SKVSKKEPEADKTLKKAPEASGKKADSVNTSVLKPSAPKEEKAKTPPEADKTSDTDKSAADKKDSASSDTSSGNRA
ncbi:MAG: hypothetical protein ACOC2C_08455, partial [Cyclonatronaceae bacterium]